MTPEQVHSRLVALIDRHPPEHREQLAARLFALTQEQAVMYLEASDATAGFAFRNQPFYLRYDDAPDGCVEPPSREVVGEFDHDRDLPGYDPRLFGDEPDVVRVVEPRMPGAAA